MNKLFLLILQILVFISVNAKEVIVDGMGYDLFEESKTAALIAIKNASYAGDVVIPPSIMYNGIPYDVIRIQDAAFAYCTNLKSVSIPESVKYIGLIAFKGCSLREITIGSGVTTIFSEAFSNCKNLESVTIPKSLTKIQSNVFENCDNLKSVYISDLASWCNINFLNQYGNPLYYADHLYVNGKETTQVIIPDEVTSLLDYSFYGFKGLVSLSTGSRLEKIGQYAFENCINLKTLDIGNSVKSIEYRAFYGCSGLTSVTIPKSVASIKNYAFYNCTNLSTVTIDSNSIMSVTRDYPFYNIFGMQVKRFVLGEDVVNIGRGAFSGYIGLTSVYIPNSVVSIGVKAFEGCINLTNINIPNSVTTIDHSAFSKCSNLANITIPNSVTVIGSCAFEECISLTSLTIPNSVTSIGGSILSGCTSFDALTINCNYILNTCRLIDKFGDVIKECHIGEEVTSIGARAFDGCIGLTNLIIPNNVTSIGNEAFCGCTNLKSIVLGNNIESIGNEPFCLCTSLAKVICNTSSPPTIGQVTPGLYGVNIKIAALYVPESSIDKYIGTTLARYFDNILPIEEDITTHMYSATNNFDHFYNYDFYGLNGSRVTRNQHGLVIVKDKKQKSRKVIVK